MSNPTTRLRMLRLTVILSCWLQAYHSVLAGDVVVQDTDPLIVYQPQASWHSSSDSCADCLNPGGGSSYHEAIYPAVGSEAGSTSSSSSVASPTPASPTPTSPTNAVAEPAESKGGEHAQGANAGPGSPGSGSPGTTGKRRRMRRRVISRLDSNDLALQNPDVTLSFNFTGSAISIFSIQPLGVATAATNNTPTNMNLTFTFDNEPAGDFQSTGSLMLPQYNVNQSVFSRSSLEEAPHELVIHVGQNSTFIFDHLVYSTNSTGSTTALPSTPSAQQTPSLTVSPTVKKHNIATFGGAVGGSVGVLGLFVLGLAINLIRRRRLAARRDRLDGESLHTNGSNDTPHMSGPAPFVPRFFPDTVIPPDPPTYLAATNHNNSTLLASLTARAYPASTLSYADVPPSSPPPPLEDAALIAPPPPFPLAVSTQPPVLPVGEPPSIPEANPVSHNLDSFVERDPSRSRSRASSRSMSYDIHGNPITNPDEEEPLRYRY